jgi:hypothetical protein
VADAHTMTPVRARRCSSKARRRSSKALISTRPLKMSTFGKTRSILNLLREDAQWLSRRCSMPPKVLIFIGGAHHEPRHRRAARLGPGTLPGYAERILAARSKGNRRVQAGRARRQHYPRRRLLALARPGMRLLPRNRAERARGVELIGENGEVEKVRKL